MIWKVIQRNVWHDIVSWQTGRLNNSTKYLLRIDDHHFKEEEVKSARRNCHKFALKLFWNAYIWHILKETWYSTVSEQICTIDHGPKLVTNAGIDWFHRFIIRVNTNNIVMWETLQNNADWDCFKTPILQGILRIQILFQVEHCAFGRVIRLFQSVGCVRNEIQFHTVQQKPKSFFGYRIDVGWFHRTCFRGSGRRSSGQHESV